MIFYELLTVPGTDKKVRVLWDTDDYEYDEPSEHHYSLRDRQINGIGEDGSQWTMGISIEAEGDNWNMEYEPEMTTDKKLDVNTKNLSLVNNKRHYQERYWDKNGGLVRPNNSFKNVNIKEWFKLVLGDYPNVDVSKGPQSIELVEMRKEPEVMLMSIMNQVPADKIKRTEGPKTEFIQVKTIINGEEKIVTVPTDYGLIINLLMNNNFTWQNKIRPSNMSWSDFTKLKERIIDYLI